MFQPIGMGLIPKKVMPRTLRLKVLPDFPRLWVVGLCIFFFPKNTVFYGGHGIRSSVVKFLLGLMLLADQYFREIAVTFMLYARLYGAKFSTRISLHESFNLQCFPAIPRGVFVVEKNIWRVWPILPEQSVARTSHSTV